MRRDFNFEVTLCAHWLKENFDFCTYYGTWDVDALCCERGQLNFGNI